MNRHGRNRRNSCFFHFLLWQCVVLGHINTLPVQPSVHTQYPPSTDPQYTLSTHSVQPPSTTTVPTQYSPSVHPQYPPSTATQYTHSTHTVQALSTPTVPTQYSPSMHPQYPLSTCTQYTLSTHTVQAFSADPQYNPSTHSVQTISTTTPPTQCRPSAQPSIQPQYPPSTDPQYNPNTPLVHPQYRHALDRGFGEKLGLAVLHSQHQALRKKRNTFL